MEKSHADKLSSGLVGCGWGVEKCGAFVVGLVSVEAVV